MVDATVRLALALHANKGAYAALLGSGISAAAGVPTGWQIVSDLISKVAALEGVPTGEDPIGWYRARYGEEPDYSRLLDELAKSPTERSALLRRYFEPTPEDRLRGIRVPSAAHRALGQLAAKGYISVFLTTNFDRLLEHALHDAGVTPTVLTTPDSLEGSVPLGRSRCTVVKLNGDYLDTRIKNTPAELDSYDPSVDRLLDRILDEYGLVICGWSADWDTALCRAFERCPSHRYATFWTSRNPPRERAVRLIEMRRAEFVPIKSPDGFFADLVTRVQVLDKDTEPATADSLLVRPISNLPVRGAIFVGRQVEIREIKNLLAGGSLRLLTLIGPGGTGKTTLAIRAAEEVSSHFADGVTFVDLSSARDTASVHLAIGRAIGIGDALARPLSEELSERLRTQQLLLVLDNFEQVTEAASSIAKLLSDCPRLRVLATSREALHIRAEHVFPVPPLELPRAGGKQILAQELETCESALLFVDRARAIRPEFRLTDETAPAVAEICRRLDGLPLAIELAAARLKLFTPEALRDHLQNRLVLLRSGPRDLPERQQTLRATMDWSYELLKPEEQRLFELVAVFSDASIPAVEALAEQVEAFGEVDVLDGLAGLIEKSLVRRVDLPGNEPRVAMLETIREFATEKLDEHPELSAAARQTHARYYADFAHAWLKDLNGHRRAVALAAMTVESQNLKIAWKYWVAAGDLEQLEKLADGLLILNDARGWYLDTVSLTTDLLSALAASPATHNRTDQEIALRTSLARALMTTKGFTPEVEEAFIRVIDLFESDTEARRQFPVLRGLASLYQFRGQMDQAEKLGREILALAERENNLMMMVDGHLVLGATLGFVDDTRRGLEHLDRAIELFSSGPLRGLPGTGGNDSRVACLTTAAFTLWLMGKPDRAAARVNEALILADELKHPFTIAYARFHSGLLHLWRREPLIVVDRAMGVLEIAEEHDFQIWAATGKCLLGGGQAGLGRFDEGLGNIRAGMQLYQGLRSPPVFWSILQSLSASASLAGGRLEEGVKSITAAIENMSVGRPSILLLDLLILNGDLLLAAGEKGAGSLADVEGLYKRAFTQAGERHALMPQLRAAKRLLRISADGGERQAAMQTLRSIYAEFTEGFDTAEMIEARELLGNAAPASATSDRLQ